jgi:hypothetical protein
MSEEWLAAESFERAHKIISAINTLSIHAKLTIVGVEDTTTPEEIADARQQLSLFLDQFEHIVSEVEKDEEAPLPGVDPRLSSLAQQFVSAKHQWPHPALYDMPLKKFEQLLNSERATDLPDLIECLRALRSLMEQHVHSDVVGIFGEL